MTVDHVAVDRLRCPATRRRLSLVPLAEAQVRMAGGAPLRARRWGSPPAFGPTPLVLVRDDDACAYPVVDGTPVLLGPERLVADDESQIGDPLDHRYAEAYQEMAFYDDAADREELVETARELARAATPHRRTPSAVWPRRGWLDATFEPAAQWDAFRHLAPLQGRSVVQLGGKGVQAVKFLLAGASEAWVVSPMVGEVQFARRLAGHVGVVDRLRAVTAVAEELPFADASVDAVYAGSTVHHMRTDLALRECARVLGPEGRLAAIEPWKAPLYDLGIAVFGKRERVPCRPMTAERAAPLGEAFERAEVVHHGTLSRYPLLALAKIGVPVSLPVAWAFTWVDDALCSLVPRLRAQGSSAALLAAGARRQWSSAAALGSAGAAAATSSATATT